jgi:hypothetical protein
MRNAMDSTMLELLLAHIEHRVLHINASQSEPLDGLSTKTLMVEFLIRELPGRTSPQRRPAAGSRVGRVKRRGPAKRSA